MIFLSLFFVCFLSLAFAIDRVLQSLLTRSLTRRQKTQISHINTQIPIEIPAPIDASRHAALERARKMNKTIFAYRDYDGSWKFEDVQNQT